jgi:hypothetical protein
MSLGAQARLEHQGRRDDEGTGRVHDRLDVRQGRRQRFDRVKADRPPWRSEDLRLPAHAVLIPARQHRRQADLDRPLSDQPAGIAG